MIMVIVPNYLRDAINDKLLTALEPFPEATEADKNILYQQMLEYFDEHGELPDFQVVKEANK